MTNKRRREQHLTIKRIIKAAVTLVEEEDVSTASMNEFIAEVYRAHGVSPKEAPYPYSVEFDLEDADEVINPEIETRFGTLVP